jgi:hypothetical protein
MSDLKQAADPVAAPPLAGTPATWNGIGMSLSRNVQVSMPQTPNGSLVFGYFNLGTTTSEGELILTSGGGYFNDLPVPALQSAPGIVVHNWAASNLAVSNISQNPDTTIYISAYGPGVPGQFPVTLNLGTQVVLGTTASAIGKTNPQNMRLKITVSGSAMGVFAIVGGPADASGNNAKVIAVNYPVDTPPPDGYYATTSTNTYVLSFNYNGQSVYVVNMSATGTPLGQVLLQAL